MAKVCPNCGYENPEGNDSCAMCNTKLESFGETGRTQANMSGTALKGLGLVRIAAILAILTFIANVAIEIALVGTFSYTSLLGGLGSVGTGSSLISATGAVSNAFIYAILGSVASSAILFISAILLYIGFGHLRQVNPRLGTGRTGALIYIIGLFLVLIGALVVFATVLPLLSQIANGGTPTFSNISGLLGAVALLLIGAILLIIGIIMVAIGLFRIGSTFNDTVTKVGGILYIFLNIIGAILLLIGLSSIMNKIRSTPAMSSEPEPPTS